MQRANIKKTYLNFSSLDNRPKTDKIVIHHTGNPTDDNLSAIAIHSSHQAQGWSGIGYHYYIRKNGQIYSGRPQWAVGSHCKGLNASSLGICLEGNFEKEKPSEEQLNSLRWLVKYLSGLFPIKNVYGHRDINATLCPGKYLYNHVSSLTPG